MLEDKNKNQYRALRQAGKTLEVEGLEAEPGEDYPTFARRAARIIDKLNDSDWARLTDSLQNWANAVLEIQSLHRKGYTAGAPLVPKYDSKTCTWSAGGVYAESIKELCDRLSGDDVHLEFPALEGFKPAPTESPAERVAAVLKNVEKERRARRRRRQVRK
jgi:hypothetical protein